MAHYTAPAVTAGPVSHHHVGLNTQIVSYTLSETASASVSIAMCALPAGARITDLWVKRGALGRDGGSGTHVVRAVVTNSAATIIGELWGQSVTWANFLRMSAAAAANPALATRLTSSSQVRLIATTGTGTSTTGTSQTVIQMCINYLADQRGD